MPIINVFKILTRTVSVRELQSLGPDACKNISPLLRVMFNVIKWTEDMSRTNGHMQSCMWHSEMIWIAGIGKKIKTHQLAKQHIFIFGPDGQYPSFLW